MSETAYERYRSHLTTLASDRLPLATIVTAGKERQWWPEHYAWRRIYGRFSPDSVPFVRLIYAMLEQPQTLCQVDVFETMPEELPAAQSWCAKTPVGWLCLSRFPADTALPTLPALLAETPQAVVVRYRPQRRCTLRIATHGETLFAKIYPDERGAIVHHANLALWTEASQGHLDFVVARPVCWDAQTCTLWQAAIAGHPVAARLLETQGTPLAERMGRAAASLTISSLKPPEVFDAATQMQRSRRYAHELRQRLPQLGTLLDVLFERLTHCHARSAGRPQRPIHGALHAHQWLDDGKRLGLVDFDRLSWGDAELDVATFLGELAFEKTPYTAQIAAAFLAGYEAMSAPLDHRLITTYRAHKYLAKALRTARAVRPDADERAQRIVQQAVQIIAPPRRSEPRYYATHHAIFSQTWTKRV